MKRGGRFKSPIIEEHRRISAPADEQIYILKRGGGFKSPMIDELRWKSATADEQIYILKRGERFKAPLICWATLVHIKTDIYFEERREI